MPALDDASTPSPFPAAKAAGPGVFLWLQSLPIRKKLYLLVSILALNLVTVISLSILGMGILSQVRAYVGGEGLWAKAQKDAIYSLAKYAHSQDEKDYADYLQHLTVPLGDRKARVELSKPDPDLRISDQGFLEGKNDPADVRGMALLFRRFHRFGLIHQAIVIWSQADDALLELQGLGQAFHELSRAERAKPAAVAAFMQALDRANEHLTALENDFSSTMGQAARWAQSLLLWVMVLGSLSIGLFSLWIALSFSRAIAGGVTLISGAASRAAEGDLSVRVQLASQDELGRLAGDFNAMVSSLARIDKLKNDFAATVSHELRTPLTLILAPLETLLAGDLGPLPASLRPSLDTMLNNGRRLLQMVNGLLDFSKLQAGKMPVASEATDLIALTESIVLDFKPALRSKGLVLEEHWGPSDGARMMDPYLYERILFNLLSNAVKFTPRGGSIRLDLRFDGPKLELLVTDTGIGISKDAAKALFQKFSQAEASSTRRFEGTGLGLALARECAQLLGGDIQVESEPGRGSRFIVHLNAPSTQGQAVAPARSARAQAADPERGLASSQASADPEGAEMLPKALVAEDNPELGAFVAALLRPIAQVRLVRDGLDALQEAQAWSPDILLSDVMMPGLDGIALTRLLKGEPATAGIPVVLLTALTSQEDLLRGWDAGADDYLFKPFHPRELQARVRSILTMVAWRKRSEQQVKRQELLEQFTRIASHDLKAPLRRIASFAGLVQRDAQDKLPPEALGHLRMISESAAQMNAMINSLLQFSRLESGAAGFELCELGAIVHQARQVLEPGFSEHGARLELGELPSLEVVNEQIFALFQNLFSNSLKYAEPSRPLRISVQAQPQGHEWLFIVSDNGQGFDPSHNEEVFVLFRRLQHPPSIPGDGMGLAIAKKVVELHGGRIWAEGMPGQGCKIYFTLLTRPGRPLELT